MAFTGKVPDLKNLRQLTKSRKYYIDNDVMVIPEKPAQDVMCMTVAMYKMILNTNVLTKSDRQLAMGGKSVKDALGRSRTYLDTWTTDDAKNYKAYKSIFVTKERLAIMLYVAGIYAYEVDKSHSMQMIRIMQTLVGTQWKEDKFLTKYCPFYKDEIMLISDLWIDQFEFQPFIRLLILDLQARSRFPCDNSQLTCDFDEDEIMKPEFKSVDELIISKESASEGVEEPSPTCHPLSP